MVLGFDWLGVECKWYFSVMAAMMNVREAGCTCGRLLWTVYNSENSPGLGWDVARRF